MTNGGTYVLSSKMLKILFNNIIVPTQIPFTLYPVPMGLW